MIITLLCNLTVFTATIQFQFQFQFHCPLPPNWWCVSFRFVSFCWILNPNRDFHGNNRFLQGAGVQNLGLTCFMGSILQCLTHTINLFQGLRSYTHDCQGMQSTTQFGVKNLLISFLCCKFKIFFSDDAGDFCVFCALRSHMESCFTPARSVVWPTFLAENLNRIFFHVTIVVKLHCIMHLFGWGWINSGLSMLNLVDHGFKL